MPVVPSGGTTVASPWMNAIGVGAPTASRLAVTTVRRCGLPSHWTAVIVKLMSFLATTSGIRGEDVRDLMVAAVEHRFGRVSRLPLTIEWLSDNGSCYVAGDTRSFARDIGLEPRTTPIESPQSIGMAEAFVRTIKRDYVRVSPCPNAETVMLQLPSWITHYNEVHPHKALGYRSPREFIAARGNP